MTSQSIIRITKELSDFQRTPELSLALACRDVDVRNVKALIIGPHETPYEFGFFEVAIAIGPDYPSNAPKVYFITTHDGRTRFNPNFYASGKICLSILGTWRGEPGEQWSPAQGVESILLSIQSLMSANPYENEPGFEVARSEGEGKEAKHYAAKIRHETLRISVIERLEGYLGLKSSAVESGTRDAPTSDPEFAMHEEAQHFEPFEDLCKRRFLWYYESYLAAVQQGEEQHKENEGFVMAPFEGGSNGMKGRFNYPKLRARLLAVKAALDAETAQWAKPWTADLAMLTDSRLRSEFSSVVTTLKEGGTPHDVSLEEGNTHVWIITYFGRPMTNLDGGMLRLRMVFSPKFPAEQPRVNLQTKIFHHHVAPDGTLCYKIASRQQEDVLAHIQAIVATLDEEEPAWDPRETVNPEATKLFWSPDPRDKKMFNRRLRRSVQDSME